MIRKNPNGHLPKIHESAYSLPTSYPDIKMNQIPILVSKVL